MIDLSLGASKPNVEVMNFFEKKTHEHNSTEREPEESRYIPPKPQQKPLFEYEGRYELTSEGRHEDDNVNNAIKFRQDKQKHTDFFFKLQELNERIDVFHQVFSSKQPKFLHKPTKVSKWAK